MKIWTFSIALTFILSLISCSDEGVENYIPTPSPLQIPQLFQDKILNPIIPLDNPQTMEGIILGKKLFFDPILSADNSQSCAHCHAPENAFSDADRFSDGINGKLGNRNSMPLFNLAWNYNETFFWDGNTFSLEHQAFVPVSNPNEMGSNWKQVEDKLQNHNEYPNLFNVARIIKTLGVPILNHQT